MREGSTMADTRGHVVRTWPLLLVALPAALVVWSGWVGLGQLCGFGVVHLLPGIFPGLRVDTTAALPIGVEAYGAIALRVRSNPHVSDAGREFARKSAKLALGLGCLGQVAYHLLRAYHATVAPWPVVVLVSCLPVLTVGLAVHLVYVVRDGQPEDTEEDSTADDDQADKEDKQKDELKPRRVRRRKQTQYDDVVRLHEADTTRTQKDIAAELKCSTRTVGRHLATYRKGQAQEDAA
jgi:hypothetical protein